MINRAPITLKKLSIIFSLLFVISFMAQRAQAQVKFGIRGGLNFANVYDFSSHIVSHSKIGFLVGLYLQYPISSRFIIQPEILYTTKGHKEKFTAPPPVFPKKVQQKEYLNYISIPILLKYRFSPDKTLSPYVAAGPYFSFLTSLKVTKGGKIETKDIGNTKRYDIGASIGAGLGFHSFNLGVRYSLGFIPLTKSKYGSTKNTAFSIVVGFTF